MSDNKNKKVALIFGATGIVGSTIAEVLAKAPAEEWGDIIVSSRRAPQLETTSARIRFVALDLAKEDEAGMRQALLAAGGQHVTHVYFTAYIHDKNWDGQALCQLNTPIFVKAIRAVEAIAPNLQRIFLQLGAKYYGIHLAPLKGELPLKEEAGRHAPVADNPDFYFEQEDFLIDLQKGKKWTYTTTRPTNIIGATRGNGMSIAPTLAVYLLVQKELGKKALYPGYTNYKHSSNAELLGEFTVYASTHPGAENEAFNFVDHNTVRETWEQTWKAIAEYFGVEVEEPTKASRFKLEEYMKDKKPVWEAYVKKNGGDPKLFDYATWDFADALFNIEWANGPFSISKAQKIGWSKELTPTQSFYHTFDKLKRLQFIPNKL